MSIQVNIFEAGSVPTAQELVTLINELNTSLDESVTLTGEQSITGVKTFLGSKLLKFKQSVSADKLGFTLYDYQGKEVGNFEYDNKNNFRLLALGNYVSAATQEVECNIGFKIYNKLQGAAYRLLCPLAGNAKNSIPSLSETYTNFYMPLVFTNGAVSVTADNNGKVDLSTLIGSGGGSGDISGLATVATTGDYNDLLNRPILFSGNYNDLTNKPTLFSGSYGDLTDKPTLFSGDYNDLTNKPTIPTVDITKALADSWYQPIGNYALKSELFSGSYNDLTDKPSLFSGNYNDLTNKPSLFSGSYNDLTDKPTLFSGSYNDLSDKPTIPTVPTISTNITSDAASDTKTASPKAVKDFVEGKSYLTEHQDISGKADQTDLEALEDRVEALEQSGGSTTQYSYLKLIPDLDVYTEASVGEIVKYTGQTNNKYTRGWDYECITAGIIIPQYAQIVDVADTNENTEFAAFMASAKKPFMHTGETASFDKYQEAGAGTEYAGYIFPHGQTPQAGDYVYYYSSAWKPHLVISNNGTDLVIQRTSGTLTLQAQPTVQNAYTFYVFTNPDGIELLTKTQNQVPSQPKIGKDPVLDYTNNICYYSGNTSGKTPHILITFYPESDTYGDAPEWQPIIHPTAPISSGD